MNPRPPCTRSQQGFALVTVLILSALLVAMLVALVTLTMAETRVVQSTARMQMARASALVGLQKAVGALQQQAGPDQRLTAQANLLNANVANPWLTGVWSVQTTTGTSSTDEPINPDLDQDEQRTIPGTPVWLMSGPTTKRPDGSEIPAITPSTDIPKPTNAGSPSVWLLRHAVGDDDTLSVKAPKVALTAKDLSLNLPTFKRLRPNTPLGHYAWWVGDEGVKAKANLVSPPNHYSGDSTSWENSLRLAAAPRTAPWLTKELKDLDPGSNPSLPATTKALTLQQLPLINGKNTFTALETGVARHFHSFTADSVGVLSDVKHGGLKRDLSLAFEMTDDDFMADPNFGQPHFGLGADAGINPLYLNWRSMRDYYLTYRAYRHATDTDLSLDTTTSPPTLKARTYRLAEHDGLSDDKPEDRATLAEEFFGTPSVLLPRKLDENLDIKGVVTTAFVPRVSRLEYAISFMTKNIMPENEGDPTLKIVVVLDPVVTLWNPFNVKLSVPAVRIEHQLPELHVIAEVRNPWNNKREYQTNDEAYSGNKIYRALKKNKDKEPPGQNGEWEELKFRNDDPWTLGADASFHQILSFQKSPTASLVLVSDPNALNTPLVLEPGEFAVFSMAEPLPQEFKQDGPVRVVLKRRWNPDSGIVLERLTHNQPQPSGSGGGGGGAQADPGAQYQLKVYSSSTVRFTVEPDRGVNEKGDTISDSYVANDPFKFIKHYDEKSKRITTPSSIPSAYSEAIGEFIGGASAYESFAWSPTRKGNHMRTTYDTRNFHGTEKDDKLKAAPGMNKDELKVGIQLPIDKKKYHSLFDWYLKTEADTDYPAQPVAVFNPRFTALQAAPVWKEHESDPSHPGFPCTVTNFQIKLQQITDEKEVIEQDRNYRSYWGPSHTSQGEQVVVLFQAPTAPLISLGQFQHYQTSLSPYDFAYSYGHSHRSPYVAQDARWLENTEPDPNKQMRQAEPSWTLNDKLFDRYFFSSICASDAKSEGVASRLGGIIAEKTPTSLPNPRMKLHTPPHMPRKEVAALLGDSSSNDSDIPPYDKAAAFLLVDGAFNVNSTSMEAWKALLGSLDGLSVPLAAGSLEAATDNIVTRSTLANGTANDHWKGYRSLTDAELESLAKEIVVEVRARGPFASLGEFVNRRLLKPDDKNAKLAEASALEAAISRTKINAHLKVQVTEAALKHAAAQSEDPTKPWDFPQPTHAIGPVMSGTPGALQQGDLLQALAPMLAVRSDTFKVRTYGDVIDPRSGVLQARAWCEAIVQRLPEYLHHANEGDKKTDGDVPWARPEALKNSGNKSLGRRFKVVSFRWLSPGDV